MKEPCPFAKKMILGAHKVSQASPVVQSNKVMKGIEAAHKMNKITRKTEKIFKHIGECPICREIGQELVTQIVEDLRIGISRITGQQSET